MKTHELALEELKQSLHLLAAPPEEQLAHLRLIGCERCVDELALELDDILPDGDSAASLALTKSQLKGVQEVQAQLAAMSGAAQEAIWEPAGLLTRKEWNTLRKSASRALALFD